MKIAQRREAFARRKEAHAAGAEAAAAAMTARFLADIPIGPGLEIGGYRPIRTEIDPTPLMRALHAQGARLSVPVIVAEGAPLQFRRWTPETRMSVGAFGAEIPEDGQAASPELFITPLVAFDRLGGRLGYGGGFYDRTLAEARPRRTVRAVGVAYAAQEVAATPREPTDERLDAIVTDVETIRING